MFFLGPVFAARAFSSVVYCADAGSVDSLLTPGANFVRREDFNSVRFCREVFFGAGPLIITNGEEHRKAKAVMVALLAAPWSEVMARHSGVWLDVLHRHLDAWCDRGAGQTLDDLGVALCMDLAGCMLLGAPLPSVSTLTTSRVGLFCKTKSVTLIQLGRGAGCAFMLLQPRLELRCG